MNKGVHVMSWITPEVKRRFTDLARAQGLSDSAYLRQVIHSLVRANDGLSEDALIPAATLPKDLRIAIRLRPDDHRLLRDRACARSMHTSAYVAALVRSPAPPDSPPKRRTGCIKSGHRGTFGHRSQP